MADNMNTTNVETNVTFPSAEEKLATIIADHGLDREWFLEHCQSGKLLELTFTDAERVRNCYGAIKNNGLLPMFWQDFKAYRQTVKEQYKARTRVLREDVIHTSDRPNVWEYLGIKVIVDFPSRQIKVIDKYNSGCNFPTSFTLDFSWQPQAGSYTSRKELERVLKTLRNKGLIATINLAINTQAA